MKALSLFLLILGLCRSNDIFAGPLARVDPHGSRAENHREISTLTNHNACAVCHFEDKGKIATKPDAQHSCSDCHSTAVHSGIGEHLKKGSTLTCLSCHYAHRSDVGKIMVVGSFFTESPSLKQQLSFKAFHKPDAIIRKNCSDCHQIFKANKFPHEKHQQGFPLLEITCVSCHRFDFKTKEQDPLSPPIPSGFLKVSPRTCENCHGEKLSLSFQTACTKCHSNVADGDKHHPLGKNLSCLGCHNSKSFSHRKMAFSDLAICNKCHSSKRYRHRDISVMKNLVKQPGFKFSASSITCLTCHRMHQASRSENLLTEQEKILPLCAGCHGVKAKELILNFHRKR